MKALHRISIFAAAVLLASGCASLGDGSRAYEKFRHCLMTSAIAGGAAGAALDGNAGGGAVGGALIGLLVCNKRDADGDGVCDSQDACPGFDDAVDGDADGAKTRQNFYFWAPEFA